jgi:purine-nucleoside phosphorylase
MQDLRRKINETTNFIKSKIKITPKIGIILGTGLGALADKIKNKQSIDYKDIPHFPVSTVPGHKGRLSFGKIEKKDVVVMEGRFHYYEGYSLLQVTYPVRVMKALGAKILIISNAAGGLNPYFDRGDLVIIEDHINLMGVNPLIGPNDEKLGPRFPDMYQPYDKKLIEICENVAMEENLKVHKGVYVGLTGPNLETRAEYRFLRMIGADCVGMSTVPEVIVGVHAGFRILGISCITDRCLPDALEPLNFIQILKAAKTAEPKLTRLVEKTIAKI